MKKFHLPIVCAPNFPTILEHKRLLIELDSFSEKNIRSPKTYVRLAPIQTSAS